MRRFAGLVLVACLAQGTLEAEVTKSEAAKKKPTTKPAAKEQQSDGERPTLGTLTASVQDVAKAFNTREKNLPPRGKGAVVIFVVANGPASKAGLQQFDVIDRAGNKVILSNDDLKQWIESTTTGKEYTFQVSRFMKRKWVKGTVKITPVTRKSLGLSDCPLFIADMSLGSDSIGTPVVNLTVQNITSHDVTAFKVEAHCYNRFGDPVGLFDNQFNGISQKTTEAYATQECEWPLYVHDGATKVELRIVRVKLDDGMEWKPKKGQVVGKSVER